MTKQPDWLSDTRLQQFFAAVKKDGGEARAVGGCVRDYLLGIRGGDVDIATTLLPEQVMALAKREGWKAVPTGIDHGTVTLVLPSRVIEVTTLRRDIETDGRHAKVTYTDTFEEDAARRDFTFNALYMDAEGKISDFFKGQEDLKAHHVRFIGDANARVEEDGLRILRFFRFLARHGESPADSRALAACASHKQMLASLSGERIAQEMKKLLAARDPVYALEQMVAMDLPVWLTESPWNVSRLSALLAYERAYKVATNPWLRLMSLLAPDVRLDTAKWMATRWKLSRAESALLNTLGARAANLDPAGVKEWLRAHERGVVTGKILLAGLDSDEELAISELITLAQDWQVPVFPVTAKDLGMKEGPEIGQKLRALEERWVKSNYTLSKEALLK